MMTHSSFSTQWMKLAAATILCLGGCSKPQPNAPTQDFAQRHHCPVKTVESDDESSNRMRVTGCGESEVYVRSCANSRASHPVSDVRQPVTEAEAKHNSPYASTFSEQGCAWTRQQNNSAPRPGSAQQPKWLSEP